MSLKVDRDCLLVEAYKVCLNYKINYPKYTEQIIGFVFQFSLGE